MACRLRPAAGGHDSSQCEFMLPTERDRCVRANESNKRAVEERRKQNELAKARPAKTSQPLEEEQKSTSPRLPAESL